MEKDVLEVKRLGSWWKNEKKRSYRMKNCEEHGQTLGLMLNRRDAGVCLNGHHKS